MKKLLLIIAIIVSCQSVFAQSQTYVNGYYRSNGTYVEGHYRTSPNATKNDNWSTEGNINPYTGAEGTKQGGDNYSSYRNNSSYYTPSNNYNSNSNYNSYPSTSYPSSSNSNAYPNYNYNQSTYYNSYGR